MAHEVRPASAVFRRHIHAHQTKLPQLADGFDREAFLLVDFGRYGRNVGVGELTRCAADKLLLVAEPKVH
jgi:hypothetical protein